MDLLDIEIKNLNIEISKKEKIIKDNKLEERKIYDEFKAKEYELNGKIAQINTKIGDLKVLYDKLLDAPVIPDAYDDIDVLDKVNSNEEFQYNINSYEELVQNIFRDISNLNVLRIDNSGISKLFSKLSKEMCVLFKDNKYILTGKKGEGAAGFVSDININIGGKELYSTFITWGGKWGDKDDGGSTTQKWDLAKLNLLTKVNELLPETVISAIKKNKLSQSEYEKIRISKVNNTVYYKFPDAVLEGVLGTMVSYLYDIGKLPNVVKYFQTFQCEEKGNKVVYNVIEQCDGELGDLMTHLKYGDTRRYFGGKGRVNQTNWNEVWRTDYELKTNDNIMSIPKNKNNTILEMFFPVLYSIMMWKKEFGICHMDLHFRNLLYTIIDTPFKDKLDGKVKAQKKYMYHGQTLTNVEYFCYELHGRSNKYRVYIPNRGYLVKIADFGLAYANIAKSNYKSNMKFIRESADINGFWINRITENNDFMTKDLKFFFNNIYYFGQQLGLDISGLTAMLSSGFFTDFNDPNNLKIPHWQPNRRLFKEDFSDMRDVIDVIMKGYRKFNNTIVNNSKGFTNIIFKYDDINKGYLDNSKVLYFPLTQIALGNNDITNYQDNYKTFYTDINSKDINAIKEYIRKNKKLELAYDNIKNMTNRDMIINYLRSNYKRYDLAYVEKYYYPSYLLKQDYSKGIDVDNLSRLNIKNKLINNESKIYTIELYPEVYGNMFTYKDYQLRFNYKYPPKKMLGKNLNVISFKITEIPQSKYNINFNVKPSLSQYHYTKDLLKDKDGFVINGGYYSIPSMPIIQKWKNTKIKFPNKIVENDPVGFFYDNNKVYNYFDLPYGYDTMFGVLVVYEDNSIDLVNYSKFLNVHETEDYTDIIGLLSMDRKSVTTTNINRKRIKVSGNQPILKPGNKRYKSAMTIGPLIFDNSNPQNSFNKDETFDKYTLYGQQYYILPYYYEKDGKKFYTKNIYKYRSLPTSDPLEGANYIYGLRNSNYLVEWNLIGLTNDNKLINILVDGRAYNQIGTDRFTLFNFLKLKFKNIKSLAFLDGGFSANLTYKNQDNEIMNLMRDPFRRSAPIFINFIKK